MICSQVSISCWFYDKLQCFHDSGTHTSWDKVWFQPRITSLHKRQILLKSSLSFSLSRFLPLSNLIHMQTDTLSINTHTQPHRHNFVGNVYFPSYISVCAFVIGYDQRAWARSYAGGLHLRWGFHSRSCWELHLGENTCKDRNKSACPSKRGVSVSAQKSWGNRRNPFGKRASFTPCFIPSWNIYSPWPR